MKWVLWTIAGLVAAVGVAGLIGWMLPVRHEASRHARFDRPREVVYAAIRDIATSQTGVAVEVAADTPPSQLITRIADRTQPFGGTWTFDLSPDRGGTGVTITERGEIYNPIFRFMARFIFGYTSTMEGFLKQLETKLGEEQQASSGVRSPGAEA